MVNKISRCQAELSISTITVTNVFGREETKNVRRGRFLLSNKERKKDFFSELVAVIFFFFRGSFYEPL